MCWYSSIIGPVLVFNVISFRHFRYAQFMQFLSTYWNN